ncbi:MAG: AtpZ/AtpI family protein [Rhodobacteraceae bacterium]|nr:AtpZ/AtpI family protein [Paracoccaceae bacterium]
MAKSKSLGDRISRLQKEIDPPEQQPDHVVSQASYAWRMVIELVVGVGMGFILGYGLDILFGTKPLIMIVLTLLGFAAGINLMLKTAKEMTTKDENS